MKNMYFECSQNLTFKIQDSDYNLYEYIKLCSSSKETLEQWFPKVILQTT